MADNFCMNKSKNFNIVYGSHSSLIFSVCLYIYIIQIFTKVLSPKLKIVAVFLRDSIKVRKIRWSFWGTPPSPLIRRLQSIINGQGNHTKYHPEELEHNVSFSGPKSTNKSRVYHVYAWRVILSGAHCMLKLVWIVGCQSECVEG